MAFTITVNGADQVVHVDGDVPLQRVLRDVLQILESKLSEGDVARRCTAHWDGTATCSCIATPDAAELCEGAGTEVLGERAPGKGLHKGGIDLEVVQCGYCESGQVMWAAALLTATRRRLEPDGGDCRCCQRIRTAIHGAAA